MLDQEGPLTPDLLGFIAAVGAVTILVVSAMEHGRSYELRADRHHRAARALGALYDRAVADVGYSSEEELIGEYNRVLDQFEENHEPLDYEMFAIRNRDWFTTGRFERARVRVTWYAAATRAWLILSIVLVIAVVGLFAV